MTARQNGLPAWGVLLALVFGNVMALGADAPGATATPQAVASFPIVEFRILGNHVLPTEKIEAAVYPFLGPDRSFETVRKAQEALTAAYRASGFGTVLVDIPEQSVDDGIVRLKVTEGQVGRVHIQGTRYYSNRRILAALPEIRPGNVPQLPVLQTELGTLAREARDREITPVLKAGDAPGRVDIDLNVKDRLPLHGSVELDNRYTADTSHARLNFNLSYDNLFQRNESLALTYQMSPARPSEVKLWALTYLGHLPAPDWTWNAYAIRSESHVAAVGTLSVIGNGRIYGAHLVHAFDQSVGGLDSLNLGADYKTFPQDILLPGDPNSQLGPVRSATPIHYVLWSAELASTRQHEHYDLVGSMTVNAGLHGIGGNDAEFEFKRYGATSSFAYLRGTGSATWRFWRGFALVGRTSFQYSNAPLVVNEQFSLGGEDTVRGYLEAEELVDAGIAGTVELRSPHLVSRHGELLGYVFFDEGVGMNQEPLPSEIERGLVRQHLEGYGVGLQALALKRLTLMFELAKPRLTGSRTQRNDGRIDFSFQYGF